MNDLARHRIARIEVGRLRDHYPRTIGRNARLGSHGAGSDFDIVVVHTNLGATGWGLLAGDLRNAHTLHRRRLDQVFHPGIGVMDIPANPLDFALHDLVGNILEEPVWRMIQTGSDDRTDQPLDGLAPRPRERSRVPGVPCYSGAIYLDDLDPEDAPRGIDAVLANCDADFEAGYRAFKLKIGRGHRWMSPTDGLKRDIEVTRAVREAFPDVRILVDANDGYDVDGFRGYLEAVADCGLFWIEEPFPESADDLRALRADLKRLGSEALVADGESKPHIATLLKLAGEGLLDVLLMDIQSYTLSGWRLMIKTFLKDPRVHASPHAWGRPLKTLYAAQFAAGTGRVVTVEGVPGHTEGVDATGYRLLDGTLYVPDRPGFGMPLPSYERISP